MQLWELFLIGVALAMDALAVSLTDGMTEPKMPAWKPVCIAGTFALFQAAMPLLGYYCGYAFSSLVKKIAPYLSFALLLFIGGKMILDSILEISEKRKRASAVQAGGAGESAGKKRDAKTGAGKLLLQGVATSLDALAVGVTLLAAETTVGIPFHVLWCAALIGGITFALSYPAVWARRKIGDRFADKAGLLGGAVLIAIGVKILVEGLL